MGMQDLEHQYRMLLGGDMADDAQLTDHGKGRYKKFLWTRVLSMTHFSMAGCFSNKLDDDLVEA